MNLNDSHYFNNRELSWLDFNDRVLDEARTEYNPLLERLRFLGITQNNLDEFFNVRVASLHKQEALGYEDKDAAGLTPKMQLEKIAKKSHYLINKQYNTLSRSLIPRLANKNIHILGTEQLSERQLEYIDDFFHQKLYPVLTPMAVDSSRPFPFIANNTLNIALNIKKPDENDKSFAMVQVPSVFPRAIKLPGAENDFILQEEIIKKYIGELFSGYLVKDMACFRVSRDMDIDVNDEDTKDLMSEVQSQLQQLEHGRPLSLEVDNDMNDQLKQLLLKEFNLNENNDLYLINGPVDLHFVDQIIKQVNGHDDLTYDKFTPYLPDDLKNGNMFKAISKHDLFLNHPYDSFNPVINFIQQAAVDDNTLAIKITLYRVSKNSPIIKALKQAANNGKQVTVLIELKARFDEEHNVHWAKELEHAGCHVIYGLVGLKTHCKLALVVRKENNGIRRYMHMGTGNYNDVTAKLYTDMGLFTANQEMGIDATNIFNMLSGFSEPSYFHKLAISPDGIRSSLMKHIDKEIENVQNGQKGFIQMKMNSISDVPIIKKLYEASAAGVKVHLIVRGICNLRTDISGISDNITVHSIVGQLLEHSRIYCFYNGGDEEVFLSSSDLMPRNLSRRVELLFPILQDDIRKQILSIYNLMWKDNVKTRVLRSDDSWKHIDHRGIANFDSQRYLIDNRKKIADGLYNRLSDRRTKSSNDYKNQQRFIPLTKNRNEGK